MRRTAKSRDESHDLLNHYLQEIARIPRLTPERERELGKKVQENDKAALEELVKANLRFVVSYAKRYRNSHVLFLDLINEGNIGLIHAARKFDPDKNVKFITYAVWWIRQAILHALSEQGGAFRLPPKRANLMYRLEKSIGAMMTEENRIPTTEELAKDLGVTVKEVQTLLQASNENFSLSSELDEESHTELGDMIEQSTIPSAEVEMEERSVKEELLQQMKVLTAKEKLVLTLRHGVSDNVPKLFSEIASFLDRQEEGVGEFVRSSTATLCQALEVSQGELSHLLLYTNPSPEASWTFWALADLDRACSSRVDRERIPFLENLKKQAAVQKAIELLPLEARTIMKLRYGILQDDELTLRDIGEILNLSRERVRQIEARAEAKCRRAAHRQARAH